MNKEINPNVSFLAVGKGAAVRHLILFLVALGSFVVLQSLWPLAFVSGTDATTIIHGLFSRFPAWKALMVLLVPFFIILLFLEMVSQWGIIGTPMQLIRRFEGIRWRVFFQFSAVCLGIQVILTAFDLVVFPDEYQWTTWPGGWLAFAIVGFFGYAGQSLMEELLFRTLPMRFSYGLLPKDWFAILASALLFGLMHMGNKEVEALGVWQMFFIYSLNGAFMAWLTLRSNGLELAWAFHWVNNWMGSAIVTFPASSIPGPALWIRATPGVTEMLILSLVQVAIFGTVAWFLFFKKKVL